MSLSLSYLTSTTHTAHINIHPVHTVLKNKPQMAGSEHAGIEFQLAGFMHGKLPERVHGMRRFCDDVRTRLRKSPGALQLMSRFTKIRILVTVDDIPLPPARPG